MTGPRLWSLGGTPPEPQQVPEPDPQKAPESPLATHTGTDPYGRAIGPLEDHTVPKKVLNEDGEEVLPLEATPKGRRAASRKSAA